MLINPPRSSFSFDKCRSGSDPPLNLRFSLTYAVTGRTQSEIAAYVRVRTRLARKLCRDCRYKRSPQYLIGGMMPDLRPTKCQSVAATGGSKHVVVGKRWTRTFSLNSAVT